MSHYNQHSTHTVHAPIGRNNTLQEKRKDILHKQWHFKHLCTFLFPPLSFGDNGTRSGSYLWNEFMFGWVERAANSKNLIPNVDFGEAGGVCKQGWCETHPGVLFRLKPVLEKTKRRLSVRVLKNTHTVGANDKLRWNQNLETLRLRRGTFNETASV